MSNEGKSALDIKHVLVLDEGGNVALTVQNDTVDYAEKEILGGVLTTLSKIVESIGGVKTIEFGKYRLFNSSYTTKSGELVNVILTCDKKTDRKTVYPYMLRIAKEIAKVSFLFEITKEKIHELTIKGLSTEERLSLWIDANT